MTALDKIVAYLHEIRREIVVGIAVLIVTGGIVSSGNYIINYLFPGPFSGKYTVVLPDEDIKDSFQVSVASITNRNGHVSGDKAERHGKRQWDYQGFLKNGYLMIAYRNSSDEGIGFGTYMLQRDEVEQSPYYAGIWTGIACGTGTPKLKRCPALMVPGVVQLSFVGNRVKKEELLSKLSSKQVNSLVGSCEEVVLIKEYDAKCPIAEDKISGSGTPIGMNAVGEK